MVLRINENNIQVETWNMLALWQGFLQIIGIVFVLVLINVAGKLLLMPIFIMMDYYERVHCHRSKFL